MFSMHFTHSYPRTCLLLAAALGLIIGYYSIANAATHLPYRVVDTATGREVDSSVMKLFTVAQGATLTVSQKDKVFSPEQVELRVGQVLDITNDDTAVHNAYCQSGDFKFNAGAQPPGKTAQVSFTKAGNYDIRCAIHPKMLLKITVVE